MINVPLKSLLFGGAIDSRSKGARGTDIEQLANSIARLGLILPLSVLQEGDKYRVIDGNRRLEALKQIHKGKKDVEVPVLVQETDTPTARAMSLAANIERLPLHPMDQCEAFAAIAKDGKPLAEIAAAFSISERQVQQRMALGALAPVVRDLYREERIDHRMAKLLTRISADEQVKYVTSGEPMWKVAQEIQRTLEEGSLSASCGLAEFVGRDAYAAAGGHFLADLFVDEAEWKWADAGLAGELANARLAALKEKVLAEGWHFFEKTDNWIANGYVVREAPMTPEQDAERERLKGREDEIHRAAEEEEREEFTDAEIKELNEIENALNAIEGQWDMDSRFGLGVVIDPHYQIHYGCERRKGEAREIPATAASEPAEPPAASGALMLELDCHLTRAVHGALVDDPDTAIRLLALAFLSDYFLFEKLPNVYSGVGIRADFSGKVLPSYDYGFDAVAEIVKASGLLKAKNFAAKMKCMKKIDDHGIHIILAFVVARSIMTRKRNSDLTLYLDHLGTLNIRQHFTPTIENFFGRLSKKQLQMVADDMGSDVDLGPLKKGEAAAKVEAMMIDDWVPESIRPMGRE